MVDREKVIKGLECCFDVQSEWKDKIWACPTCPYAKDDGGPCETLAPLLDEALALLKAQEPKPPIITENVYGWKFYHCPSCGREFYGDRLHGRMNKMTFCDKCGQAVKWDD